MPHDQIVECNIRERPTDPDSTIVFVVRLELSADSQNGSQIGWEITSTEFRQKAVLEPGDKVWGKNSPTVGTPDGLWWVTHGDPDEPKLDEFVLPPSMNGTAAAEEPSDEDLDYTIQGIAYSPPPGGPPFDVTGSLSYSFTIQGESEPEAEGDDEPVEVRNGGNDPE